MKIKRSQYPLFFLKNTNQTGVLDKMLKGGFIHQSSSGIYVWMHLGLRVLEKIEKLINEELHKINAVKMLAPINQPASLWKESGRYELVGKEMLKIYDRNNKEFTFGASSEEVFSNFLSKQSYNAKNFPIILYNNQWKFRDEIRPRHGVIRSREFLMNDAYSFDLSLENLMKTYKIFYETYVKIFEKLNIEIYSFNSEVGYMGGFLSHEFVTPSIQGETKLKFTKQIEKISWEERDSLVEDKDSNQTFSELGHIYALGDKYSKTFNIKNPVNNNYIQMGCYGIGISRIVGILFEKKENLGNFAPYSKILLSLNNNQNEIYTQIYNYYNEICWDDREENPGVKFVEAELMQAPFIIKIGKQELETKTITVKNNNITESLTLEQLFNKYGN